MSTSDSSTFLADFRRARRAMLVADVMESVRLIESDEDQIVRRWRNIVRTTVLEFAGPHGGRLVKSLGDGMLIEFSEPREAVSCALQLIDHLLQENRGHTDDRRIELRIGIHVAEVIVDELDLYGTGVNLAARLASLAGPGEIIISATVRDSIADGLDAQLEDLGECHLRHLPHPVHAYRVGPVGPRPAIMPGNSPLDPLVPSIAVIPFADRGNASDGVVVGELIADGVISLLSKSTQLRVISRLSSSPFRDRQLDLSAIGRHLATRYILSGTCYLENGRLILAVELADAMSQTVLWADRLIGSVRDILFEDNDLLRQVSEGARIALQRNEVRRAMLHPLPTLESSTLLVAAVALMHRAVRTDFIRVREMLEHLIDRHRRNPIPRAWLAKWHVLRVTRGIASANTDDTRSALEHTGRALDVDPGCSLALAVEGFVYCHMLRNLDEAGSRYELAIEANPNDSIAWLFKGVLHSFRNEASSAVGAADRALQLSPLDPMLYFYQSLAASAILPSGDYPRVIELAQASLKSNRSHTSTYRVLAMAQALSGSVDTARETVQGLLQLEPRFTVQQFLQRSPTANTAMGPICADALRSAGVPEN